MMIEPARKLEADWSLRRKKTTWSLIILPWSGKVYWQKERSELILFKLLGFKRGFSLFQPLSNLAVKLVQVTPHEISPFCLYLCLACYHLLISTKPKAQLRLMWTSLILQVCCHFTLSHQSVRQILTQWWHWKSPVDWLTSWHWHPESHACKCVKNVSKTLHLFVWHTEKPRTDTWQLI